MDVDNVRDIDGKDSDAGTYNSSLSSFSETTSGFGTPIDCLRCFGFIVGRLFVKSSASGRSVSISLFVHVPSG